MSWGPKQQPNGSWRVGWDNPPGPDGKRDQGTRTFKTEDEATNFKITLDHRGLHGAYGMPDTKTKLSEWAQHLAAARALENVDNTVNTFAAFRRDHIDCHPIGRLPLAKITRVHVDAWVAELKPRYAPSTLREKVSTLAGVFNAAVDSGLLLVSPVRRMKTMKLPKVPSVAIPVLTPAQVIQLADAVPPYVRAMVIVGAGTGMRAGEIRGLRVGDFRGWMGDHPTVVINSQLTPQGVRRDPKTEDSARTLPITPAVKAALQRHMAQWPPWAEADGLIFWRDFATGDKGRKPCVGYNGGVSRAAGRLAVDDPTYPAFPRGHNTHLLRYHFASHMVVATGGDLKLVANMLGHVDTTQLTKRYLQALADGEDRIRSALTALWEGIANDG